jgi:hypothetical protein
MKCLSLMQPFATLIMLGVKRYETRTWRSKFCGKLAIHASSRFPEAARALCRQEPFRSLLLRAGYHHPADLPTGAILGTARLEECVLAATVLQSLQDHPAERAFGDFGKGRWAWKLSDPTPFERIQPCRGRLGLFDADVQEDLF